ncbi:MAG: glycine cleavage system aminomethyltransferase GcvT [bacterium]|nr:glycine cleavage system aminomethyltransferase GcvT [bacterium]
MQKETALYRWHVAQGAKIVDFHGWSLPVQYTGLMAEHAAVRNAAGLFDVSHMGEIEVAGPGALEQVNHLVSNNIAKLGIGQILYTVACKEDGGILDDLLIYRLGEERFWLVVNAGNLDKLAAWTAERIQGPTVTNLSGGICQIAIQGPRSREIMLACPLFASVADRLGDLPYYEFFETTLEGQEIILSRTGYTGEVGYEIYVPNELAEMVAESLMTAGGQFGLMPCGLGCRDTLRFEASYCLYGNELDETTDPYEAGLFWLVKMKKGDFIGREALALRKDDPEARRLVGFECPGRKVARHGFRVFCGDEEIGVVTTGSFSPTLGKVLGIAKIRRAFLKEPLTVEIRGERIPVETRKMPFYQNPEQRA